MAIRKGERVEPGIWRRMSGDGYIAEVNYIDPQTGRRKRERKSTHRLDLAQEWRLTRKADALRGEVRRKTDRPKPMRFEIFAEEYIEQWAKIKKRPSTCKRDQSSIKRLGGMFARKILSEITRRDIERYLSIRQGEGVAPATMNRELCCLKNMLRKAVDWGYLQENPAWGVKQQRESPKEFEFLTEAEIERVLKGAKLHPNEDGRGTDYFYAVLVLAIYTGMRRGEIFGLAWTDVSFDKGENGLIVVRDTKNGDTRYIPMNAPVREALQDHARTSRHIGHGKACPWVFHIDGEPLRDVRKVFAGTLKRAEIDRHVRFHDLRHTFASHLVMKGVDLRTVAKLMGHRDIKMTMRYAHLAPEHLQAAVDVLMRKSVLQNRAVELGHN